MNTFYIGHNQYRVRYFKSPLGYIKFMLDVFIHPNFINVVEHNLSNSSTEDHIRQFAKSEIERLENLK